MPAIPHDPDCHIRTWHDTDAPEVPARPKRRRTRRPSKSRWRTANEFKGQPGRDSDALAFRGERSPAQPEHVTARILKDQQ
jgi:hypothetical protein